MSLPRSLSQSTIASEQFAAPVSQAAIAEEWFAEPIRHLDSQSSSATTVVSFDCTKAGNGKDKVKKLQRDNQRLKRRNDILVAKVRLHQESQQVQSSYEKRPSTGFMIALARNIGNGSALSAACWSTFLGAKSSTRQTVMKWEQSLATSILSGMARFHIAHESEFRQSKDCVVIMLFLFYVMFYFLFGVYASTSCNNVKQKDSFYVAFTMTRGDAARSNSWRENKLQGMELKSAYYDGNTTGDYARHTVWPDCQVVIDNSGKGTFNILTLAIIYFP